MSNNYNNIDNNIDNNNRFNKTKNLLNIYEKVMLLKIFVDTTDNELKNMYYEAANIHNNKVLEKTEFIDAGFDLFAPGNEGEELDTYGNTLRFLNQVNKLDFKICCSAQMLTSSGHRFNTGYYLYPRSSISKTRLRLANSTGIIDSGYRGHIMAMFDLVAGTDYYGEKYDRYAQICAPSLVPILVDIVNTKEELGVETERGSGGFGSTGR